MSAWVCSENHINTLATFLAAREITVKWHDSEFACIDQPENVATILMAENVASVNYRYNEDDPVLKHTYTMAAPLPELVVIHKLFRCYEYQACEHPGWEQCLAHKLCEAGRAYIRHHMGRYEEQIEKMPEWDQAPWGIE